MGVERERVGSLAVGKHFGDLLDRAGLRERDQLVKLGLLRGEPGRRQVLEGVVGIDGDLLRDLRAAPDSAAASSAAASSRAGRAEP